MGSVLASKIMADAGNTLLDYDNTRWPDLEKFGYLNDGQRLVCLYKPDAFVVSDAYQLVKGTKQTVPDGTSSFINPSSTTLKECIRILDIIRNMISGSFTFLDADVGVAADTITEVAHDLSTGSIVVLSTTGVLPAGLTAGTYYAIVVDVDTFMLATTAANALAGTQVNITAAAGGGTHTVTTLGTDPGTVIDPTDLQLLNAVNDDWHNATPSAIVQAYVLDERYPKLFYVYPPQPSSGQGWIDMAYSAIVADIIATNSGTTNLWDAAASIFTTGTYAWAVNGTNTIANTSNRLKITYVDDAKGAYVDLKDTADLSEDLVVGQSYTLTFDAMAYLNIVGPSPQLNARLTIGEGAVLIAESSEPLALTMKQRSIEFIATSKTAMRLQVSGMTTDYIVELDNLVLDVNDNYGVPINLSNVYESAIYYYILYRAYSVDAALSPFNASRAIEFWNLFVTELGRLDLIKKGVSPNVKQPNPSPSLT